MCDPGTDQIYRFSITYIFLKEHYLLFYIFLNIEMAQEISCALKLY